MRLLDVLSFVFNFLCRLSGLVFTWMLIILVFVFVVISLSNLMSLTGISFTVLAAHITRLSTMRTFFRTLAMFHAFACYWFMVTTIWICLTILTFSFFSLFIFFVFIFFIFCFRMKIAIRWLSCDSFARTLNIYL